MNEIVTCACKQYTDNPPKRLNQLGGRFYFVKPWHLLLTCGSTGFCSARRPHPGNRLDRQIKQDEDICSSTGFRKRLHRHHHRNAEGDEPTALTTGEYILDALLTSTTNILALSTNNADSIPTRFHCDLALSQEI
ncbi:hypothetical protein SprV_0100313500 [Sparganum proliferum]